MSRGGGPPEKSSLLPARLGPYIVKGPSDLKLAPIQQHNVARQQSGPPSGREPSSSPPPSLGAYRRHNRVHSIESLGLVSDPDRRSDESDIRRRDERNSSIAHGYIASYSGSAEHSRSITSTVSRVGSYGSLPSCRDTVVVPQRSRTWLEGEAESTNLGRSANLGAPSQNSVEEGPVSRRAGPSNFKRRRYSESPSPKLDERETQSNPREGGVGPSNQYRSIVPLPRSDRHLNPRTASPSDEDCSQSAKFLVLKIGF